MNLKQDKPVPQESQTFKPSPILPKHLLKIRGVTEYEYQISPDVGNPIIPDPKQRLRILLIQKRA